MGYKLEEELNLHRSTIERRAAEQPIANSGRTNRAEERSDAARKAAQARWAK
jgi:hypothetical protein